MNSRNWIGGEWITPHGREIIVKNPSNLIEEVGVIHLSNASHVYEAERAAKEAGKKWSALTRVARGEILFQMAKALEESLHELAALASSEMGKPIGEMRGEIMRGVHLLQYYAAEGVRSDGNVIPASDTNVLQYTKQVPLGVVGIITPWNFPVAIPIWKMAPALICGNTVIWKPAETASLSATRLMEIFSTTNLPAGVVNLVIGKGREIGSPLLEQVALDAVSFTGSSATGNHIAVTCARRNIKYQTEMGGKNAAVVLRDADLEKTIPILLSGAFRSAGQKCTATGRIIVEREIYPQLVEGLKRAVSQIKMAPALDPDAYLGPVACQEQFEKVREYASLAQAEGEIVAEHVNPVSNEGFYIHPTIVSVDDLNHTLVQEEIFGPLAVLLQANDFDHAIELCNQTVFGLSASLFTKDLSKAHRFLDEAQAGMVRVNQETAGVEYQAPFGGMKLSGSHAREQGQAALDFYSQIKTCAIKHTF